MPLRTTTIGAYPKPDCTPIGDWFMANKGEAARKASKGLLSNWTPGDYELAISNAGEDAEEMFLGGYRTNNY